MNRRTENKIVLIVRKTRLDDLTVRFNTREQARFYIEHLGADFEDYQQEDDNYKSVVATVSTTLSQLGRLQVVDRAFLPNFIFGKEDTVVALGQDGLVANVLKYLDEQCLIGVNPDRKRWEGILLPFEANDLPLIVSDVLSKKCRVQDVTMAKITLNNGETLYGVNDLFIGPKTHTSARYEIMIEGNRESQSSSGIIVSTGLGSTGWLRSVLAGATSIAASISSKNLSLKNTSKMKWDSDYLYFSVREPWPSNTSSANITFGKITDQQPLKLISAMPEHGVIFSDGMENDFLPFNSGTQATITLAEKRGKLVV